MGQLAQKIAKGPTKTFGANTEKNPKEECKAIVTRSQKQEGEETNKVLQDASKEEHAKEKENNDKVSTQKTKSQLAREARREIPPAVLMEATLP